MPGRFTIVQMFEGFLQGFTVDEVDDTLGPPGATRMVLTHTVCEEEVCDVDDGDTLGVLLVTANEHTCMGASD